jgi:hypothetical protein
VKFARIERGSHNRGSVSISRLEAGKGLAIHNSICMSAHDEGGELQDCRGGVTDLFVRTDVGP